MHRRLRATPKKRVDSLAPLTFHLCEPSTLLWADNALKTATRSHCRTRRQQGDEEQVSTPPTLTLPGNILVILKLKGGLSTNGTLVILTTSPFQPSRWLTPPLLFCVRCVKWSLRGDSFCSEETAKMPLLLTMMTYFILISLPNFRSLLHLGPAHLGFYVK